MSVKLITSKKIWVALTSAAQRAKRPAYVAVAYFGQNAAKLLPLSGGSRLVVDASEDAVKNSQTCPDELLKLYNKGVRVFSVPSLHAKIFVFGSKAYIGSMNVSNSSAVRLVEVAIETTAREPVSAAREFVRDLCNYELGPEEIRRLAKLYRPPRLSFVRRPQKPIERTYVAQLIISKLPEGSEKAQEDGRVKAKRSMEQPKRHVLDDFFLEGKCTYKKGDIVMQVADEGGDCRMVSPLGRVVNLCKWSNGKRSCTFVYVEMPKRRRMKLEKLANIMGHGSKKELERDGRVNNNFARRLQTAWSD